MATVCMMTLYVNWDQMTPIGNGCGFLQIMSVDASQRHIANLAPVADRRQTDESGAHLNRRVAYFIRRS